MTEPELGPEGTLKLRLKEEMMMKIKMEIHLGRTMEENGDRERDTKEGIELNLHHKGSQGLAAKTKLTAHSIILSFIFSIIIYPVKGTGQYARHYMLNKTKLASAVRGAYILVRELDIKSHDVSES